MSITTKDELAKQVAERTGLDTSQAKLALDATIAEITAQLADGPRTTVRFRTEVAPSGQGTVA